MRSQPQNDGENLQRRSGVTGGPATASELHALRLLAGGECVNAVALELGYNSASAFIAMFHRELGQTPRRYFES